MKKLLCVLMSVVLLAMCTVPTIAKAEEVSAMAEQNEVLPVVIVRGLNFTGLYLDYGTEQQAPVIGGVSFSGIMKTLFKAVGAGFRAKSFEAGMSVAIDYVDSIMGKLACDKNGNSVYNIGVPEYPLSIANYNDFNNSMESEEAIVRASAERYGGENTYYVNYDWRLNPLDIADKINESVKRAVRESGKSKVRIVCASMGGEMTMAYLTKYGYDDIDSCIFLCSAFYGIQVATDMYQGKIYIGGDTLANFVKWCTRDNTFVHGLMSVLEKVGVFNLAAKLGNKLIEKTETQVFDEFLRETLGLIPSFWAVVRPESYEACLDYIFGDNRDKYADFIEMTEELQAVMNGRDALLKQAVADGVKIAVLSNYNSPLIPIYENAYVNGDRVLETELTSGGAIVADYGKTLGDNYVGAAPEHISPDRVVDASTCLFPEYTWLIKDASHVACDYGSGYADFLFWLLDFEGQPTVKSNSSYPQFMRETEDMLLVSQ